MLQDIFNERTKNGIVILINQIQLLEKEKLLLIAAQHLDVMYKKFPSIAPNMGSNMTLSSTAVNAIYSSDKIIEIQVKISDILEEFQSLKCDYLE